MDYLNRDELNKLAKEVFLKYRDDFESRDPQRTINGLIRRDFPELSFEEQMYLVGKIVDEIKRSRGQKPRVWG